MKVYSLFLAEGRNEELLGIYSEYSLAVKAQKDLTNADLVGGGFFFIAEHEVNETKRPRTGGLFVPEATS